SFFKDLSPTDFSSLSLHDALPIYYFFPIHLNHSSFFNSYRHNGVDWKLDHIFCGKKKGVSSMSGFCSRTQAVCWGKLFPFGSFCWKFGFGRGIWLLESIWTVLESKRALLESISYEMESI